jgi:HTH-type transcriptional regulator/antitoxin MqsA
MKTVVIKCPVCEQGHLLPEGYEDTIPYNGSALHVDGLQRHRCDTCGADPVLTDQIKANQLRIADAKRAHDGLLRGDQIRKLREHFGLSQSEAATVFGGGGNAFSKYERGEVIQSVPMDRLLRLVLDVPGAVPILASYCGLALKVAVEQGDRAYVETSSVTATAQLNLAHKSRAKLVVVYPDRYESAA